jgi:hypothetical protein
MLMLLMLWLPNWPLLLLLLLVIVLALCLLLDLQCYSFAWLCVWPLLLDVKQLQHHHVCQQVCLEVLHVEPFLCINPCRLLLLQLLLKFGQLALLLAYLRVRRVCRIKALGGLPI